MALNDAKDSTLSALLDPSPQPNQKNGARRRYRRCRSVPTDLILQGNNDAVLPRYESIFNVHPSFWQVTLFLALYLGVGTVCFYLVKDQIRGQKTNGILDAVYFCIVTMTTVGYGDLVPNSVPSKLLACAFVFTGMALIGLTLSKSADYLVEKQESLLVKCLHINKKVGASDLFKEIEENRVKYKFILNLGLLVLLMVVGTIFLSRVEHLSLVDAFYCVCSTITTLGYGDKSFSTDAGRIFAVFWILTSTVCLGLFFLHLAELSTERKQQSLVNWVLRRKMTYIDLEAADLDDDGVLSAAEFIIYKLKEMGKINQEDIALVMKEFEDLDVDQSGTLSASDIALAQSYFR
ncbi:EF-hand domain [Macleaya cordata]|uniref:EF-hand domain n=1 Tax=Macleaya cordata TaxID=56857 RepID=A0A200PVC9_MACCD|nr:EF-hand domain [Macleaya cordata]